MFRSVLMARKGCGIPIRNPRNPLGASEPHRPPTSIVCDREYLLVAAAKAGHAAPYEELVTRYEDRTFFVTPNISGNPEAVKSILLRARMEPRERLNFRRGAQN